VELQKTKVKCGIRNCGNECGMLSKMWNVENVNPTNITVLSEGNRNFRSQELSFPDTKVLRMELSLPGAKVTWNFRSQERKYHGTFVPKSKNVAELSLSVREPT